MRKILIVFRQMLKLIVVKNLHDNGYMCKKFCNKSFVNAKPRAKETMEVLVTAKVKKD